MDDPYDSPDSDGHGSIPSANVTMNIETPPPPRPVRLPPRRRRQQQQQQQTTPLDTDSEDDDKVTPLAVPPRRRRRSEDLVAPQPSRVLRPKDGGNESPIRIPSRGHRRPSSEENVDPDGSEGESENGEKREDVERNGDASGARSTEHTGADTGGERALTAADVQHDYEDERDTGSPDPETGLSKRIAVRKYRNSPAKYMPSSPPIKSSYGYAPSSPTPAMGGVDEETDDELPPHLEDSFDRDENADFGAVPQSENNPESEYQLPPNIPNVTFTDDDLGVMHQRFAQTSSVRRPYRPVSGWSDHSQDQEQKERDSTEEIGPSQDVGGLFRPKWPEHGLHFSDGDSATESEQDVAPGPIIEELKDDAKSEVSDESENRYDQEVTKHSESGGKVNRTSNPPPSPRKVSQPMHAAHSSSGFPLRPAASSTPPPPSTPPSPAHTSSPADESPQPSSPLAPHLQSTSPTPRQATDMPEGNPSPSSTRNTLQDIGNSSGIDWQALGVTPDNRNFSGLSNIPLHNRNDDFDLSKFKNSRLARRVSITTPSTQSSRHTTATEVLARNPPHMLSGPGFKFSLPAPVARRPDAHPWETDGDTFSLSPLPDNLDGLGTIGRKPGSAPPPLSTNSTPVKAATPRERRLSDPLDKTSGFPEEFKGLRRALFPSTKLDQQLPSPGASGDDSTAQIAGSTVTEASTARPMDSHFGNFKSSSPIFPSSSGVNPDEHMSSLQLGDVEVRAQTPSSVGDDTRDSGNTQHTVQQVISSPARRLGDTKIPSFPAPSHLQSSPSSHDDGEKAYLRQRVAALERTLDDMKTIQKDQNNNMNALGGIIADAEARCNKAAAESEEQKKTIEALEDELHELGEKYDEQAAVASRARELERRVQMLQKQIHQHEEAARDVSELEDHIAELEEKLHNAEAKAAREEEQRKSEIARRDAEIESLRTELDELAPMLPGNESVRSQNINPPETSQLYDQTMDQIFTELTDSKGPGDAVLQAEKALRQTAAKAGLRGDVEKHELAALGIRQLRSENEALKKMIGEGEAQMKLLREDKKGLEESIARVKSINEHLKKENADAEDAIGEKQKTISDLRSELQSLQKSIAAKEKQVKHLTDAQDKLRVAEQRIKLLEKQAAVAKEDRIKFIDEIKRQKHQLAEEAKHSKERDEEIIRLRQEINLSTERAYKAEDELTQQAQRLRDLVSAASTHESEKAQLQSRLAALERELGKVRTAASTLTADLDRARLANDSVTQSLKTTEVIRSNLESKVALQTSTISTLQSEKSKLVEALKKLDADRKTSSSRLASLQQELTDAKLAADLREIEVRNQYAGIVSPEPYERALYRIAAEFPADPPTAAAPDYARLLAELEKTPVAKPEVVARVLAGVAELVRAKDELERRERELEEKNRRLKAAIRKWGEDKGRDREKVEGLRAEVERLRQELMRERRSGDEKIGNLILALRGP